MKINASVCDENSIQILCSHTLSIEAYSMKIYDIMSKKEEKVDEGEGEGDRYLQWRHFSMTIHSISIHPFI